jgi:CHASE2 domain-containing sensor protein
MNNSQFSFPKFLITVPRQLVLIVLLPLLLIPLLVYQRTFNVQDNFFYDAMLQLRPLQNVSPDIAIIEIDDKTLSQLGQWPLPRDFHATLVNILDELGAKAIVFDVIFSEPTEYDAAFAESIKTSGHVYLPEVFDFPEHANAQKILDQPNPRLTALTESLQNVIPARGHINIFVDPDGKIRRVPLYIRDTNGIVPQLSLQAACGFLKLNCANAQFDQNHITIDHTLHIPVADNNEFLINYPGRWKESFTHFSYLEIIALYKNWVTHQSDLGRLAQLKGKACFIGLTAAGTVDLGASTLETNYPMVGLNASIFNSVLNKQFLKRVAPGVNIAITMLIYLLSLWIGMTCKPMKSLMGSLALILLFLAGATALLHYAGIWVEIFLPLAIIVLMYLVCVSLRWAKERYQREVLEKEIRLAQKIQLQFLQGPRQDTQQFDAAVWFRPARYVSGDFYDLSQLNEHTAAIFVGDVSGKGLSAALCMAQAISLLRIFSKQEPNAAALLNRLNQELCLRESDRFVTALYCTVNTETGTVNAASAGHGPLYVYRHQERKFEEILFTPRSPLGVMDTTVYHSLTFQLNQDDKLFLISDGVTEARNTDGRELGLQKIKECFINNAANPNKRILEVLTALITDYAGAGLEHDDMTMIIFSLPLPNQGRQS